MKTPTYDPSKKKRTVNRKIDVRAKCLTLPTKPPADASPQKSTKSSQGKPSTSRASSNDENWVCGVCNGSYNADVKKRNNENWIACSFCGKTYHEKCQIAESDVDVLCVIVVPLLMLIVMIQVDYMNNE